MGKNRTAVVLALLTVLILAFGMDVLRVSLRAYRAATFSTASSVWWNTGINLVFALSMLWLAWLLIIKNRDDRVSGMIFFIVGLLVFLSPLFYLVDILPLGLPYKYLFVSPESLFALSGAIVLLIGLVRWLHKS
jgi:hypothetical protein